MFHFHVRIISLHVFLTSQLELLKHFLYLIHFIPWMNILAVIGFKTFTII